MRGTLALVLHAHLPFVRHPEQEDFLEEDWLYEAITETYLPLLIAFDRLHEEGVAFRLTLTLTPPLLTMLGDPLLLGRYGRRLDRLLELAQREVERTRGDGPFQPLAIFYRDHFSALRRAFVDRYGKDLVKAFRRLEELGHLELITSCATHAFLPLMQNQPEAVRAQVAVAVAQHRASLGKSPPGFWLAECGYYPGVEHTLAEQGLRYFFLEAHGLADAEPRPLYSVYAPVFTEAGVAAFGRDPESSQQVWDAHHGYPSHPVYREFYRDIGWDLPLDYIRPYVQPTGERKNTGIKYYRITGQGLEKEPYDPAAARAKAEADARDFLRRRGEQGDGLAQKMKSRPPVIVAPYDAELFGHWWFEGPWFLEALLRAAAQEGSPVALTTPSEDLRLHPENQLAQPAMSSWGERGYAQVWLDGSNDWIYRHLNACAAKMVALARDFPDPGELRRRALNQAARELLLAQASDWAFIMKSATMVEYAVRRTRDHVLRFLRLEEQIRAESVDVSWLHELERKDNIFPDIDFRIFQPLPAGS